MPRKHPTADAFLLDLTANLTTYVNDVHDPEVPTITAFTVVGECVHMFESSKGGLPPGLSRPGRCSSCKAEVQPEEYRTQLVDMLQIEAAKNNAEALEELAARSRIGHRAPRVSRRSR